MSDIDKDGTCGQCLNGINKLMSKATKVTRRKIKKKDAEASRVDKKNELSLS